jgi:hypothetical protein
MNKRLHPSDYLISIIIVFLLVCVAGAFFIGFEIGHARAGEKYSAILAQKEAAQSNEAYNQQHLVSFYHTIYEPGRKFQDRWFERLNELERPGTASDHSAVMAELAKFAEDRHKELMNASTPAVSPLLGEAHRHLLESLSLFGEAAKAFEQRAKAIEPIQLAAELKLDRRTREAQALYLRAQETFYRAIARWPSADNPDAANEKWNGQTPLALDQWRKMGLNAKNAAIAAMLANANRFVPLLPQDLTVRVDEMIMLGQADRLNLADVSAIVSMLLDTNAARAGDFAERKDKWYAAERLPLLPFFYEAR